MKIKTLTYNIHKGFNTLNTQFLLADIKDSLRETQADIVFLQEVVGENLILRKKIKEWPTESQFEYLADTLWPHFSYGKNAVFPQKHHGNAILSQFPIIRQNNLNISNHRWEQRGLLHIEIELPPLQHKKIHLFNTHIDLLTSGRQKQMKKIAAYIQAHVQKNEPVIFAGDFNDWPGKIGPELKKEFAFEEAHSIFNGFPAKTFPHFLPLLSLDRIYFRGMKVISCETLAKYPWNELSDHLPILAEFEFS